MERINGSYSYFCLLLKEFSYLDAPGLVAHTCEGIDDVSAEAGVNIINVEVAALWPVHCCRIEVADSQF